MFFDDLKGNENISLTEILLFFNVRELIRNIQNKDIQRSLV